MQTTRASPESQSMQVERRTRPVTYGERRQVNGENKLWTGAGTINDVHSADGTVEGSPSGDMVYQGSLEPICINVEVGHGECCRCVANLPALGTHHERGYATLHSHPGNTQRNSQCLICP